MTTGYHRAQSELLDWSRSSGVATNPFYKSAHTKMCSRHDRTEGRVDRFMRKYEHGPSMPVAAARAEQTAARDGQVPRRRVLIRVTHAAAGNVCPEPVCQESWASGLYLLSSTLRLGAQLDVLVFLSERLDGGLPSYCYGHTCAGATNWPLRPWPSQSPRPAESLPSRGSVSAGLEPPWCWAMAELSASSRRQLGETRQLLRGEPRPTLRLEAGLAQRMSSSGASKCPDRVSVARSPHSPPWLPSIAGIRDRRAIRRHRADSLEIREQEPGGDEGFRLWDR